jgi:hypothetical protein
MLLLFSFEESEFALFETSVVKTSAYIADFFLSFRVCDSIIGTYKMFTLRNYTIIDKGGWY